MDKKHLEKYLLGIDPVETPEIKSGSAVVIKLDIDKDKKELVAEYFSKPIGIDILRFISFQSYQEKAVATAIYGEGNAITYPALGLANEAGEVLGKIKKVLRDKEGVFNEENNKEIGDEIGDVLWYIAALCRDLNLNMGDIANNNLIKLADRQKRGVIHGNGDQR